MVYVKTCPKFNDFGIFELLFSPKYTNEMKERPKKGNGNGVRMSPYCNVLLTKNENDVLFKNVILELLQSICAVDGKLISKVCKPSKCSPQNLNVCIETIPPPHFLKFRSSGQHRSPPCYNILLFLLIGLTTLKFLWAGEAVARWGTLL